MTWQEEGLYFLGKYLYVVIFMAILFGITYASNKLRLYGLKLDMQNKERAEKRKQLEVINKDKKNIK